MAILTGNQLSLLFQAKGDTKDAQRAFDSLERSIDRNSKKIKSDVGGMNTSVKSTGASLSSLAGPAAIAAAGIAAVATIAVTTARAMFDLATSSAAYGASIENAREKTGLMAETLSALRFGADAFGTSFELIEKSVVKFAKVVGDSRDGLKEAERDLRDLGVNPQEALNDLDGTLAKVFKKIIDAKPGIEQMTLAQKAFGKSGADLIPFLVDFDGNLEGLTERAREMGLVFDRETVVAADKFEDTMRTVKAQLKGVTVTLGNELLPTFTRVFQDASRFLIQNKSEISAWAQTAGFAIEGLYNKIREMVDFVRDNQVYIRAVLGIITVGASEAAFQSGSSILGSGLQTVIDSGRQSSTGRAVDQDFGIDTKPAIDTGILAAEQDRLMAEAEKRQKEREALIKRDVEAQKRILESQLSRATENFSKYFDEFYSQASKSLDPTDFNNFVKAISEATNSYNKDIESIILAIEKLESAEKGLTGNERTELQQKQQARRDKLTSDGLAKFKQSSELRLKILEHENEKTLQQMEARHRREEAAQIATDNAANAQLQLALARNEITREEFENAALIREKAQLEQRKKNLEEVEEATKNSTDKLLEIKNQLFILDQQIDETESKMEVRRLEALQKEIDKTLELFDLEQKRAALKEEELLKGGGASVLPELDTPESSWLEDIGDQVEDATNEIFDFATSLEHFKGIAQSVFGSVAQGIGAMLNQWVLYGNTSGKILQQIVAQTLAAIAAESAVRAVYAAGYGFLMLALFNFDAAAKAFIAAGIFAGIAGGAALAGRAVAGNSFANQQTSGAFGSSTQSSGQGSSEGGAYSSLDEQEIEIGRNSPLTPIVNVNISGDFADWLKTQVELNTPTGRLIRGGSA